MCLAGNSDLMALVEADKKSERFDDLIRVTGK